MTEPEQERLDYLNNTYGPPPYQDTKEGQRAMTILESIDKLFKEEPHIKDWWISAR